MTSSLLLSLGGCSSSVDGGNGGGGGTTADASPQATVDAAPGAADAAPYPAEFSAKFVTSCNLENFAGFQITIFPIPTECTDYHTDEYSLQFTIGETRGAPQANRTYPVPALEDQEGIYPPDGEARLSLSRYPDGEGGTTNDVGVDGEITIISQKAGTEFVGTYDITTSEGFNLTGSFYANDCYDPADCQ